MKVRITHNLWENEEFNLETVKEFEAMTLDELKSKTFTAFGFDDIRSLWRYKRASGDDTGPEDIPL